MEIDLQASLHYGNDGSGLSHMNKLTHRERFLKTVRFDNPDRVPLWEFGYLDTTIERWKSEGLPQAAGLKDFFGLDSVRYFPKDSFFNILGPLPPFNEEILEETEEYKIYIDGEGITKKDFKDKTEKSMPLFLKYPIESRKDWEIFKKRLDPYAPGRYPQAWEAMKNAWKESDFSLTLFAGSFFGLLRNWIGVENFSVMFYDDPALVEEMIDYMTDFFIASTKQALDEVQFDHAHFWEDMAYKNGPLISPEMVEKFMVPGYKKVMKHLRSYGIDVFSVDCDGNIDELIPIWLEVGINGMLPCEVAAGMNVVDVRKKYGQDLWIAGGIDKRALSKGKKEIDDEVLGKLPFMLEKGGYIPTVDHEVPHDIPLANYMYYLEQVKKCVMKG